MSAVQSRPCQREVSLLHSLVWVRELAVRFEFDFSQWSFLVASVEQALYKVAGAETALFLTSHLSNLSGSLGSLGFVGTYLRQTDQIALTLLADKTAPSLEFEWEDVVCCLLSDSLHQTEGTDTSVLCRHIVQGESPLYGVKSSDLKTFSRLLVNASRPLMERNWLDQLEDSLAAVVACLEYKEHWLEQEDSTLELIGSAVESLSEAFLVVDEDQTIEQDLYFLIQAAVDATLYSTNLNQSTEEYARYYALGFGFHRYKFWKNAAPLIRGTVTKLARNSKNRYLAEGSQGLKVFASTEQTAESLNGRVVSLASASAVLQNSGMLQGLAHRIVIECSIKAKDKAMRPAARWCLSHLSLLDPNLDLAAFSLSAARALPESELSGELKIFSTWLNRIKLSEGLWKKSTEIGQLAAVEVYREMPEYGQQTEGQRGLDKCSRDNAFTLRKLALAFWPEVVDPSETFAASWRNLVGQYVHNRPAGLFKETSEALVRASSEHLEEQITALLRETLTPVYMEAESGAEVAEDKTYQFPAVGAFHVSVSPPEDKNRLRTLLVESRGSLPLPGFGQQKELQQFLEDTLPSGLSFYRSCGHLDQRTLKRLLSILISIESSDAVLVELYFARLRWELGSHLESLDLSPLAAIAMIQACLEFTRLTRLGRALEAESESLCDTLSPQGVTREDWSRLRTELVKPLSGGSAPWSRFESLRHCLLELSRPAWEAQARHHLFLELARWGRQHLDPPLLQELGVILVALGKAAADTCVMGVYRKMATADTFLFSPTPTEEEQWRRLIAWSVLKRQDTSQSLPEPESVVASLAICMDYSFPDRLEKAYEFIAADQDSSWSGYLSGLKISLQTTADCAQLIEEESEEILEILTGSLSASGVEVEAKTVLDLMRTTLAGTNLPDRFRLPALPLLAHTSYRSCSQLTDDQFEKISEIAQGQDSEIVRLWQEVCQRLAHYRASLSSFVGEWEKANEQPDYTWLIRRQWVDVLIDESSSFEWFRREYLPYQERQDKESILGSVRVYSSWALLQQDSISLKIRAVDLLRNVSSALTNTQGHAGMELALSPVRASIRERENTLAQAVAPFRSLVRDFRSSAAADMAIEQLTGVNSRLDFEKLKALYSQDSSNIGAELEKEQLDTLSQSESLDSIEFFARWDLLERRADLLAAVELVETLSSQNLASRLSAHWVHSIASYSEPSVFGQFLARLPHEVTAEELAQLEQDFSDLDVKNARLGALLERWKKRLTLITENLDLLTEPKLEGEARSLAVGAICAQDDETAASALRLDDILQSLQTKSGTRPADSYSAAFERVRELFLAHDLTGVRREMEARQELTELLDGRIHWEAELESLEERLWVLFPGQDRVDRQLHKDLLKALPLILSQPRRTPTYWKMSSILVGLGSDTAAALIQSSPDAVKKWQMAILNAASLSHLPRRPFEEGFAHLNQALQENQNANVVLRSPALRDASQKITPSLLLSLKVASDLLNGTLDAQGVSEWLVGATSNQAPSGPSGLLKSVKGLLNEWSRGQYCDQVVDVSKGVKLRLDTAAGKAKTMTEMMGALEDLAETSDRELEQNRGWFTKLSDSFEAVVRG